MPVGGHEEPSWTVGNLMERCARAPAAGSADQETSGGKDPLMSDQAPNLPPPVESVEPRSSEIPWVVGRLEAVLGGEAIPAATQAVWQDVCAVLVTMCADMQQLVGAVHAAQRTETTLCRALADVVDPARRTN